MDQLILGIPCTGNYIPYDFFMTSMLKYSNIHISNDLLDDIICENIYRIMSNLAKTKLGKVILSMIIDNTFYYNPYIYITKKDDMYCFSYQKFEDKIIYQIHQSEIIL